MKKIKVCTKCKKELPLGNFGTDKKTKDGLSYWCKGCQKQQYYKIRDQKLKYAKEYRGKNKERIKEWKKRHYKSNKKLINNYKKEWYLNNRESVLEQRKRYREENESIIKKKKREYNLQNPGNGNIRSQRYKARKRKLPSTLTREQWENIKTSFDNSCAYCGLSEEEHLCLYNEHIHQDHFISLSQGGEYTHNNIVPACKICNIKKSNNNFFEWYPSQPFYSKQRERKILRFLEYDKNKNQQLSIL